MPDEFDKLAFLLRLGKHIERIRKAKGYSQNRVALESSLSKGTPSRIERADVDAQISTLAEIAYTLGVSLAYLVDVPLE
jgi:transcriptional regulator with XRE-family HTH domain